MKRLFSFLDERTGYRALLEKALDEEIRGGASWAYVFGSALAIILSIQVMTGIALMLTYTPSVNEAWSSVYYIEHKVTLGWLVRGLHHYGAQAMVVVLGFHLLQVVIYGAYKAPREATWWVGLALLGLVQGLALTGYLLPWDQKGYWATKVATNIAGTVPVVGEWVQTALVGGSEYGQATITRFFALHVGLLPLAILALVGVHIYLFRRNGVTPRAGANVSVIERFYPHQVTKDVIVGVVVVGAIVLLAWRSHGAPLDAPADPSADYPPRPEWYFLFLFQLLKYLPGNLELVGTVILPGLAGAFLFALPFIDRAPTTQLSKRWMTVGPVLLGAAGIVALTTLSLQADAHDTKFQASRRAADTRAKRVIELAANGIPPLGPTELLQNDPMSRGYDVYEQYCTSCHTIDGRGKQKAPTHTGYGSRKWILGLVHRPRAPEYFGHTKLDDMPSQSKLGEDALNNVAEFLFEQGRTPREPAANPTMVAAGEQTFRTKCMACHTFKGEGDDDGIGGPNLTGYGSLEWIRRQITDPGSPLQYGEMNHMPTFADELSEHDADMVAQYLRAQRFR